MASRPQSRFRRLRRATAALAVLIAVLATAAVAQAHTSATCVLSAAVVRCTGTIADQTMTAEQTQGYLQVDGSHGRLFLESWPLIRIIYRKRPVHADLICSKALALVSCSEEGYAAGPGCVNHQPVAVTTIGAAGGSSALITLSDAPATQDPPTTGQSAVRRHATARSARSHHRRRSHQQRHRSHRGRSRQSRR
jgi:hypothetical protein